MTTDQCVTGNCVNLNDTYILTYDGYVVDRCQWSYSFDEYCTFNKLSLWVGPNNAPGLMVSFGTNDTSTAYNWRFANTTPTPLNCTAFSSYDIPYYARPGGTACAHNGTCAITAL
jgi:hypothetical protein